MTAKEKSDTYDRFGYLQSTLAPLNAEHEKLKKLILSWFESEPPDKAFAPEGERYVIAITERANKREFKPGAMKRLAKFIGSIFWSLCKITMEDFDGHVPEPERDRFVEISQSGARKVKAIAKNAKAA